MNPPFLVSAGIAALGVVALVLAWLRWARVAQREHYHPDALIRIARLWMRTRRANELLAAATAVSAVMILLGATIDQWVLGALGATAAAVATAVFPWGLALRGADTPLAWTRRLKTLTAVVALLVVLLGAIAVVASIPPWSAPGLIAALLVPIGELALRITVPIEARIAEGHRRRAESRLVRVAPTTIAITGSWGKTTTKNHVRQLIGDLRPTAISPASFNNLGGLSRTMNEHLPDSTEVLVVEMGMYGPGEIRALCDWVRPSVGVITAIGPMHLERVGSIEGIVAAKSEIIERTECAVLWVAQPELARVADTIAVERPDQRLIRCGTEPTNDVCVMTTATEHAISVRGRPLGVVEASSGLHPANIACAIGALVAIEMDIELVARNLSALSAPDHRATQQTSPSGVTIIDDTFNSNPVGARHAIERLTSVGPGRKIVVSPGMVELGPLQYGENLEFARFAADHGVEVIAVGRTNRDALLAGAELGGRPARWVPDRESARSLVATELGSGDAVLWENDLPDHYP